MLRYTSVCRGCGLRTRRHLYGASQGSDPRPRRQAPRAEGAIDASGVGKLPPHLQIVGRDRRKDVGRPSQDRNAPRRRHRAPVRGVRRHIEERSRRRHGAVRLHSRPQHRDDPDVARPAVRHGRKRLLGLVLRRRRHGPAGRILSRRPQAQRRRLPDPDRLSARHGLVQEGDQQPRRSQGPEISHLRHRRGNLRQAWRVGRHHTGRRNRAGDGTRRDRRRRMDQLRGRQEARSAPGRQALLHALACTSPSPAAS